MRNCSYPLYSWSRRRGGRRWNLIVSKNEVSSTFVTLPKCSSIMLSTSLALYVLVADIAVQNSNPNSQLFLLPQQTAMKPGPPDWSRWSRYLPVNLCIPCLIVLPFHWKLWFSVCGLIGWELWSRDRSHDDWDPICTDYIMVDRSTASNLWILPSFTTCV